MISLALISCTTSAIAECRMVENPGNGEVGVECDEPSERLPVCGSEYDTGDQCVAPRHRRRPIRIPTLPPPRPRLRESEGPESPAGPPPRAPGAPWPNPAERYKN